MKNRLPYALMAVLAVFLLPPLLSPLPADAGRAAATAPVEEGVNAGERSPWSAGASGTADAALTLTLRTPEGDRSMTMADYLPLALAGEMPASFETEALKAQAVALRTYVLRQRAQPKAAHPEADVCTDPGCCAAFGDGEALRGRWGDSYESYMARLRAAAEETDGEYLSYEGAPALAVFHASSGGSTENGTALGVPYPYLVSVDTPETVFRVASLQSTVEVSAEELRETVSAAAPAASFPEGNPSAWLGPVFLDAAGRVDRMELGGAVLSGPELRRLFSLRSTDFTLVWDGTRFVFRVSGYGHGVGMSQQGANLMAADGADYREILAHYYPGTELLR